ncbi:unnamed protein product [Orchesella dallaii]|uniref:Uncharacterized protein n=1 Tax=Orchesella dallaii TaxID=48710 RepID=A0ABP1SBB2_9HEXA
MGDTLQALPRIKKNQMGLKCVERGSFARKVDRKRAAALMPIALSFGRFYPMGANFCRNFVGNLVEDLMAVLVGRSILSKDLSLKLEILNEYFKLEYKVLSRHKKTLVDPKRKEFLDMFFWGFQLFHVMSIGLIPFLIYLNIDTVYWVFEDIFGESHLNRFPLEVSVIVLSMRVLILSTTLIENARMMVPSTLLFGEAMRRITKLVSVLSYKLRNFAYLHTINSRYGRDTLQALPRIKKNQMGLKYVERGSFARKVDRKRAAALMPIALSFGRFYPMGANFCRNFGNLVEHLMAGILVIEDVLT